MSDIDSISVYGTGVQSEKDLILKAVLRYSKILAKNMQLSEIDTPLLAHTLCPSFFLPVENVDAFQQRLSRGLQGEELVRAKKQMKHMLVGKFIGTTDGRVLQVAGVEHKGADTSVSFRESGVAPLPASQCMIMPMQEYAGDWKHRLTEDIGKIRELIPSTLDGNMKEDRVQLIQSTHSPSLDRLSKLAQLHAAAGGKINVIFAHAAISQTDDELAVLEKVGEQFRQHASFRATGIEVPGCAPLFLQYFPGLSGAEQARRWKEQLLRAKAAFQRDGDAGTNVVVFTIRDDEDQQSIYRLVKYLCDSTYVSIQSLVVDLQTLTDKTGNLADAAERKPDLCNTVTIAVRSKASADGYYVQTYGESDSEIRHYDPAQDLAKVLGINKISGKLTLLRSGFMHPDAPAPDANAISTLGRSNTVGDYLASVSALHAHYKKGNKRSATQNGETSVEDLAQNECARIAERVLAPEGQLSYVLIREPKSLSVDAEKAIDAAIKAEVDAASTSAGKKHYLLFPHDPLANGNPHTISAQRITLSSTGHGDAQVTNNPAKPIILTLLSDRLLHSRDSERPNPRKKQSNADRGRASHSS